MTYRILYLWRGERHVHAQQPETKAEADSIVKEMQDRGWTCWHEPVGQADDDDFMMLI